ncbi:TIGR01777 family oxidoreductase [Parasediminibacterium sp. JCM 36343]|uniref:TIGR01777 family oxidoreductase n=1 Tax=Parasediminibacterium sp. JCM 36343 TaxID=3374279 RepID=UPI00397CC279
MAKVLIAGGTGMIGKHLTELLIVKGYDVIILTRSKPFAKRHASISYALWDVEKQTIDAAAIAKADYIINLAGAGVADKRWSATRKKEIVESRVKSSALIVKALKTMPNKVACIVSASAIGWYGADTPKSKQLGFLENEPADNAFLGETCRLWEESMEPVIKLGKRLVKLRIGIVLSNEGGALPEFKNPLKVGIAAILGNGDQVISWVHIEDLCRMFVYALENENMNGAYNAVAPNPVTNNNFTIALAKIEKGSFFIPVHVPAFVLKLAMGEMSVEILKSATVSNAKIKSAGLTYKYPELEGALKSLNELSQKK